MLALFTVLVSCDADADIHDNIIVIDLDFCSMLELLPAEDGEDSAVIACDADTPCAIRDTVCLCGQCVDLDSVF